MGLMQIVTHSPADGVYAPTGDYVHAIELRQPERFLTVIVAETLEEDWLVEIEVIAAG